ncbi:hypothetical protein HMPREF3091_15645 [Hafnia sp. HMSC23F03]|nr:hypothetical protein HMPREF3091_15645 [Hafnia sp. HMSC23F03]
MDRLNDPLMDVKTHNFLWVFFMGLFYAAFSSHWHWPQMVISRLSKTKSDEKRFKPRNSTPFNN